MVERNNWLPQAVSSDRHKHTDMCTYSYIQSCKSINKDVALVINHKETGTDGIIVLKLSKMEKNTNI